MPRRYLKALKSLKANENIKVVQTDKGRKVVICYMTTYRNLANSHFSDTKFYKPVEPDDVAGRDLKRMTDDFTNELNEIIARAPHTDRKIIEALRPD